MCHFEIVDSRPVFTCEQYKALGDIVARDTKARHACGIPAPSYNQLKGLHDVRNYTEAEQVLILRRLVQPYNCGNIDVVSSKKTALESRPAATKTRVTSTTARGKPAGNDAGVSNSETKKPGQSTVSAINITGDDEKSSGGTPKKTADSGSGKGVKTKRYALHVSQIDVMTA